MIIDIKDFKEAIVPIEKLINRKLSPYEFKKIYYTLFDSIEDREFKFVIKDYAINYYGKQNVSKLEESLIIDLFKKYNLTHHDLDNAFKIRIQKVLSKARIFPTPAELIVLIKPDVTINIYDENDREKALSGNTNMEINLDESFKRFKKMFSKV
jgi:hypothetical protein